ncbi:hypothetical protein HDU76_009951, partial [Blyttiomyces sp. JEL0837]
MIISNRQKLLSDRVMKLDMSHKLTKCMSTLDGMPMWEGCLAIGNEFKDIVGLKLCLSKAQAMHWEDVFENIASNFELSRNKRTELVYTDNPEADRRLLIQKMPWLAEGIEPIITSEFDHLQQLEISDTIPVQVLCNSNAVATFLTSLLSHSGSPSSPQVFAIALDAEWNVTGIGYGKFQSGQVAVIQIATASQKKYIKDQLMIRQPKAVMSSENIVKASRKVQGDINHIFKDHCKADKSVSKGVIQLGRFCKEHGFITYGRSSLEHLCAEVPKVKLGKREDVRISDWEADTLNTEQVRYAALDVWASFRIYEETSKVSKIDSISPNTKVSIASLDGSMIIAVGVFVKVCKAKKGQLAQAVVKVEVVLVRCDTLSIYQVDVALTRSTE